MTEKSDIHDLVKSARKRADSFRVEIDRPRFAGDPVKYLQTLLVIRHLPLRARAEIGYDHQDLQYCADVWEQAAIVAKGDADFAHEHRRYQKLCDDLKAGMVERRFEGGFPVGIMLLDLESDWPSVRTILRAIQYLEHAEIRGLQ